MHLEFSSWKGPYSATWIYSLSPDHIIEVIYIYIYYIYIYMYIFVKFCKHFWVLPNFIYNFRLIIINLFSYFWPFSFYFWLLLYCTIFPKFLTSSLSSLACRHTLSLLQTTFESSSEFASGVIELTLAFHFSSTHQLFLWRILEP